MATRFIEYIISLSGAAQVASAATKAATATTEVATATSEVAASSAAATQAVDTLSASEQNLSAQMQAVNARILEAAAARERAIEIRRIATETGRTYVEVLAEIQGKSAQVSSATNQLASGLESLSRGNLALNASGDLVVKKTGEEATALQILNSVGIKTEKQIRAEIAALNDLAKAFADDSAEAKQLTTRQAGLEKQLEATASGGGKNRSLFSSLSSVLFSTGRATGVVTGSVFELERSLATAVPRLIEAKKESGGLAAALKGPAGVGLALAAVGVAATVALPLVIDFLSKGTEEARELEEAVTKTVESLIQIEDELPKAIKFQEDIARAGLALTKEKTAVLEENLRLFKLQETQDSGVGRLARRDGLTRAETKASLQLEKDIVTTFEEQLRSLEAKRTVTERLVELGGEEVEQTKVVSAARKAERERVRLLKAAVKERERLTFLAEKQAKAALAQITSEKSIATLIKAQRKETEAIAKLRRESALFVFQAGTRQVERPPEIERPLEGSIRALEERRAVLLSALENVPFAERQSPILLALIAETEAIDAQLDKMGVVFERGFDLGSAIEDGMASATVALIEGSANFLSATGSFASELGRSLIAFGFAGLALKSFLKDPLTAIAAGTVLVLIGSQLSASAASSQSRFTSQNPGLGARSFAPRGRTDTAVPSDGALFSGSVVAAASTTSAQGVLNAVQQGAYQGMLQASREGAWDMNPNSLRWALARNVHQDERAGR